MRLPPGNSISSTWSLMFDPLHVLEAADVDLVVEVADVADDRAVLHRPHVIDGDDVLVAGRGDEDVGALDRVLHRHDLVAFHRRLQRADRIDLGDEHAAAGLAQRGGRALADVAVAGDHRDLARHHHVGAAADAVDQRFTAAVEVVELRLGDAVVDVDAGEQQRAVLLALVEAMHARRRLFRHALDRGGELGEPAGLLLQRALDEREQDLFFLDRRASRAGRERPCRPSRRSSPGARTAWRRRRRRGSCWARRRPTTRGSCGCTPSSP